MTVVITLAQLWEKMHKDSEREFAESVKDLPNGEELLEIRKEYSKDCLEALKKAEIE